MNFIAIDLGSTFIKAAIYDLSYEKVIFTYKYHTPEKLPHPDAHYFEIDAQKIVDIVKNIIDKCSEISVDIAGIIFSTQQHGCVLHHPDQEKDIYISWQDTRCLKINPSTGLSYITELEQLLPPSRMQKTGVPIKPALALCNLYALFQEERLRTTGDIRLYTLGSYVIENLTGNNICHITNAAPMGFVDLKARQFDHTILKDVGLDFMTLPEITNQVSLCGTYRTEKLNINVYPDLGDVQTSVYGTGAKSGDMVINIGTSGQLILISDDYEIGDYEIRPYYDNNYCYVISRMPGGRNFDVQINYMQQIGEKIFGISLEKEEIWERLKSSCVLSDTDGLEVDCSFYELPDRLADGKVLHINHSNFTPEHVIAATANDYGHLYRQYSKIILKGKEFCGTLYFSGGAVLKNPFLKNAIQKAMKADHMVSAQEDEVYGGMFLLAKRCIAPPDTPSNI